MSEAVRGNQASIEAISTRPGEGHRAPTVRRRGDDRVRAAGSYHHDRAADLDDCRLATEERIAGGVPPAADRGRLRKT